MKSYIWKTVFLLAIVSAFVFIIMKPADRLVKTVSVNRLESFGQLYFKKIKKISPNCSKSFDESRLNKVSPALEITDSCFIDRINGVEVRNPTYKFLDDAYFVNTKRKTFIVTDFAAVKDDPKSQLDVSSFKTRKAYSVYDGSKDTGEVIYCQVDALGNEYVYSAYFENTDNRRTDYIFELSKVPYEEKTPSQLGICANYETDGTAFEWKFGTEEKESSVFEKREVRISDGEFYFSPYEEKIEQPHLVPDENAFFQQDGRTYAAMYFVGEKWDSLNSVDVSDYDEMKAYDIYTKDEEKTNYKIYILTCENETDIYVACLAQVNDLPSYCEYLVSLKKAK